MMYEAIEVSDLRYKVVKTAESYTTIIGVFLLLNDAIYFRDYLNDLVHVDKLSTNKPYSIKRI